MHQPNESLKVHAFDSSVVSALSNGTNEWYWNTSDYGIELQSEKQSAVSSVTGVYENDLKYLSTETRFESSLVFNSSDDVEESSNPSDIIRDEIERVQAFLDQNEARFNQLRHHKDQISVSFISLVDPNRKRPCTPTAAH
jgi:hypothetical protein